MTETLNSVEIRQGSWKKRLATLSLLFGACVVAYWIGNQSASSNLANGGLTIDEASLDFGTVWEDAEFPWKLLVHNANSTEIEVRDFASSCTCLAIEPRSFKLAPGETRELKLKLDLRPRTTEKASAWEWPFEAALAPQIGNEPVQQSGWIVRGRVRKFLEASPASIIFEGDLVRGQPFPRKSVRLVAATALAALSASCDPGKASIRMQRLGRREYQLTLKLEKNLEPGEYRFDLKLQADNEKGFPQIRIPVRARVVDELQIMPQTMALGMRPVGEIVDEEIMITSFGRSSSAIEIIKCVCDEVQLLEHLRGPNVNRLRIRISRIGEQHLQVPLRVRHGDVEKLLFLRIGYHGLARQPLDDP